MEKAEQSMTQLTDVVLRIHHGANAVVLSTQRALHHQPSLIALQQANRRHTSPVRERGPRSADPGQQSTTGDAVGLAWPP